METIEIQEFGLLNEIHLCDSCHEELPNCDDGKHIIYGTGQGGDNICACSSYNPVHVRHYDTERDIMLETVIPFKENLDALDNIKIR